MSRFRLPAVAAGLVLTALAVVPAACGTTEDPESGNGAGNRTEKSGEKTAEPTEKSGENGASGPITVTDSRGEEITLDAPAERVVALEWSEAEDLVTLGVMPVGVADVEGYSAWVGAVPLDDSVTDVGTRAEPSVDAIVALEPDLVLVEPDRGAALVEQLEEYVPVITFQGADAKDNIGQMKHNFEVIATAVGKEDVGAQVLSDFDATLAEAEQAIAEAGADGEKFMMADGWLEGGSVAIRWFGTGSLLSQLAEEIGLENAWAEAGDEAWGLGQTDVEGLRNLPELHFFYSASGPDDVFADELPGNRIWDKLPFVTADTIYKLEPGTWTFGGPGSSEHFVSQVVEAVTR